MTTRAIVAVILLVCFVVIIDGQERGRGGHRNQGNDVTTDSSVHQGRGREPGEKRRDRGRGPEVPSNQTETSETATQEPGRGQGGRRNQGNDVTTDASVHHGRGQRQGREPGEKRQDRGRGPEVLSNQTEANETTTHEPGRGQGRFRWRDGKRDRPSQFFVDVSRWNRTFNGSDFVERGFAIANRSIVEVFVRDPSLNEKTPFTPSITLYDFSNETQVVAIKPTMLLFLCIIVDPEDLPPLTFQQAADIVNGRNNSVVDNLAGPVVLNITEGLLEDVERGAQFRNNSMLQRFCGERRIVRAVVSTDEASKSPSANFILLDAGVKVHLPPRNWWMRHHNETPTTTATLADLTTTSYQPSTNNTDG